MMFWQKLLPKSNGGGCKEKIRFLKFLSISVPFFLLASNATYAASYYWQGGGYDEPRFSDPQAVCMYYVSRSIFGSKLKAPTKTEVSNFWNVHCLGHYTPSNDKNFSFITAKRKPSTPTISCPPHMVLAGGDCKYNPKNFGAPKNKCSTPQLGDPISVSTGNLYLDVLDYRSESGLSFSRFYNSAKKLDSISGIASLGISNWSHTFSRTLAASGSTKIANRQDGSSASFVFNSAIGDWIPETDANLSLRQLSDDSGWQILDHSNDSVEKYDSTGKLVEIEFLGGYKQMLAYGDGSSGAPTGYLTSVVDSFGTTLSFSYDAKKRIFRVTVPGGGYISYGYSGDVVGNLVQVTYPDNKALTYIYNEAERVPAGYVFLNALTGIVDENGNRFASFSYDDANRAISSEHNAVLGGQSIPIEKISFTYNEDKTTRVVDSQGVIKTYSFSTILGVPKNTKIRTLGHADFSETNINQSYDQNGNISSRSTLNGFKTCSRYDPVRNLETVMLEGVPADQSCPSDLETYPVSSGTVQRIVKTTWHPTYRLPLTITEPGKVTTFNYDTNGNLLGQSVASVP